MWFKYPIIVLLFFIAALLQFSFLPHLNITAGNINLIFILFFILIFFEKPTAHYESIFIIGIAGFLLDVFSYSYFGMSIIFLLIIYIVMKVLIHFLKESQDGHLIIYFMVIFLISLILYDILSYSAMHSGKVKTIFEATNLFQLVYNLALACAGFYLYTFIDRSSKIRAKIKLFR